jgi:outer membrane receptor for ferrienterochelin and colicins
VGSLFYYIVTHFDVCYIDGFVDERSYIFLQKICIFALCDFDLLITKINIMKNSIKLMLAAFLLMPAGTAVAFTETAAQIIKDESLPKTDANIIGHIVDAKTHAHIPHSTVRLEGTSIGALTDNSGHYRITNVPEGTYNITAKFVGYETKQVKVNVVRNKTIEVNFELNEQAVEVNPVVVTGTRSEASKKDISTIVSVLPAQLFENTSSYFLAEGVAFQPGVRVEYTCANCGVPQLLINGLAGEYSQILMNSRSIFSSLAAVYNLEQLPTSMIDRVEVIRGGGSALFGSNAVAGVVNIITKDPSYNSVDITSNIDFFGNGQTDKNVSFGASLVSDDYKTGAYVYGVVRDRSSYDRNKDGFTDKPEMSEQALGARITHRFTDFSKLTLDVTKTNDFRRGGDQLDKQPFETEITEQLSHDIYGGSIQYDHFSQNQKHYLSIYTAGQWIDRDSYFGADKNANAYGQTNDQTITAGIQYIFKGENPIILPYEFTAGFEYNNNILDDIMLGYDRHLHQEVNIFGAFVQNEWKSEMLNFVLGARLDKHNLINNPIFNPRASIRYTPVDNLAFRGSYARGYRAPQTYNEDLHVGAVGGDVWLISLAPDLQPEYSNSFSLSADWTWMSDKDSDHPLQTNILIEGFYTALNDVFALVEIGRDAQGNLLLERQNSSGATVKGINLEGIIGIVDIADLQIGVTYQQSRYNKPEVWSSNPNIVPQEKMFRSPDFYAYFTANVNIMNNLKANVFGKYTGPMLVQHFAGYVPQDEEVTTQAFFDMGAKITYSFALSNSITIGISIGVKNVLDAYQTDLDVGKLKDASFIYGPLYPRTFFFELKFNII